MINPIIEWKKLLDLKQITYENFPIKKESKYYFLQNIVGPEYALVYERNKKCYFINIKNDVKIGLYVLSIYKEILDAKKKIDKIVIPGIIGSYRRGEFLSQNKVEYFLKNSDRNLHINKLIWHFPVDIYKYNGNNVDFSASINWLAALCYNRTNIRVPRFYKGDLKTAWSHFKKIRGLDGIIARNSTNYIIKERNR